MKKRITEYQIFNLIIGGIFLCIFIYSGVFSHEKSNHPIPSYYTLMTGKPSISTGLSRGFSAIMSFDFETAYNFNKYALQLFVFFLLQLLIRIAGFWFSRKGYFKIKYIVGVDLTVSIPLFLYCFWPFIINPFVL